MKNIISLYFLLVILSSCVGTKKYASYVDQKIEKKEIVEKPWLLVKMPSSGKTGDQYNKVKSSFVPALLYWSWNSTIDYEIDPVTSVSYLKEGIYKAADSLNLKQLLNGKRLEINLEEVPGKFQYVNKGNAIIFVVAYSTSSLEAIAPYPVNMEATYQIIDNNTLAYTGKTTVLNQELPLRNAWKSTKKFTWRYLDAFEKETDRMGLKLVESIISQLNNKTN